MHVNKSLFGGALLSAGMMTGAAHGQFTIDYSVGLCFALDYSYFNSDSDSFAGPGPFSIQADVANQFAEAHSSVWGNSTSIGNYASISGNGGTAYGYNIYCGFSVGQDVLGSIDWDWTGGQGNLELFDITNGNFLLQHAGIDSGSVPIAFQQGVSYQLRGFSFVANEGDHSVFWEVQVPAPGTAGLAGVAGLLAARRRRSGARR